MGYKLLWYSIPALHDRSNGAAIHCKIMLESLVKSGVEVKALNATAGDDPAYLKVFEDIAKATSQPEDRSYMQFTDSGIEYFVIKTQGRVESAITAEDQGNIFSVYTQLLEKFQPDAVMGYSGDCFSVFLRHEARVRGIPSVYALCNGLHLNFAFHDCDLVFTPSKATAALYDDTPDLDVKAVGQFIDERQVVAEKREGRYVTFVNPGLHKGLAVFARLADIFRDRHPDVRFLVVKNTKDQLNLLSRLHYADGSPYVTDESREKGFLTNCDFAEHTDNMRAVYGMSRVVMMLSLWHEAWGCVATEAVMNGIPVLATTQGGLPEAVGEGGICVDAPEASTKDYERIPTDEEMEPFVSALERLLSEDWSERCGRAASQNSLESSTRRLLEHLTPVMEQGRLNKRPYGCSTYYNRRYMDRLQKSAEEEQAARSAASSSAAGRTERMSVRQDSKSSKKNRKPTKRKKK